MAVIDDRGFSGLSTRRPRERDPRNPLCLKHQKRICGTCGHFEGLLRPSRIGHNPEATTHARCAYFDQTRNLNYNAAKCNRWHRKSAPYQGAGQ